MADKSFRVLLDLTELKIDNIKYVWVNVSPLQLKTIHDFKASILQKVNLASRDISIFVKEGLLLDEETILVLREDDTVKVQYEELCSSAVDNLTKEQKKCVKRNYSECANNVGTDAKRCKIDNVDSDKKNEVVQKKKRKKSHKSVSTALIVGHAGSLEEKNHITEERSKEKDKNEHKVVENNVDESNKNEICDISENNATGHSEPSEKNNSYGRKVKKKDKVKSDNHETNVDNDDTNTKCDMFFSFVSVDPTVKQHENISSDITMETDTFLNSISSQNSIEVSAVDINVSAGTGNSCSKKKRRRHRKRKNTISKTFDISQDANADKFVSFSNDVKELETQQKLVNPISKDLQNTDAKNEFISLSNKKGKHIIYSSVPCESGKNLVETCDSTMEVHNPSNGTYAVNEDISAVNPESFKDYPKVSTPNQSGKCRNLSWHVSSMQNTYSVTNKSGEENIKIPVKDNSFAKENAFKEEKKSAQIEYENLPALNSFPDIGTRIVYKVLELDESYSPVVSEYREGLIKGVNHDTQEVEIELVKEVVKPGRTGKFENLKIDENPSPQVIRCDTVLWSSIISPKRMY